jgi:(p)ppGpp synthase/HD superfamily hydrolase
MARLAARGPATEDGAAPDFIRDSHLLARAYEFARRAHANQRKRGAEAPFIRHPVTVAELLHEADLPEELLAAALLHDVVENSEVGSAEVEERFCPEVARLVVALSEDPAIDGYESRKLALRDQVEEGGAGAVAIYAADKLANIRDAREAYRRDTEALRGRFEVSVEVRIELWRGDLEMVERTAPELGFLRALRYELEALEEALEEPAPGAG